MRDEINIKLLELVHPNVPKFALGRLPREHYKWAHPVGLLDNWKMTEPTHIPERFKNYVCFGSRYYETDHHYGFSQRRGIPVCGYCERPWYYLFFYCIACGKPFIRDFGDSRFCGYYPHCYDCLPRHEWDYCPDHSSAADIRRFTLAGQHTYFKPNGLSPKIFTEQEIADAFAFLDE